MTSHFLEAFLNWPYLSVVFVIIPLYYFLKGIVIFCPGWYTTTAQWIEYRLWNKGSPVQFPVRAHAWVGGQVPSGGYVRGNHTSIFSPSLTPSLPLGSKNKYCYSSPPPIFFKNNWTSFCRCSVDIDVTANISLVSTFHSITVNSCIN